MESLLKSKVSSEKKTEISTLTSKIKILSLILDLSLKTTAGLRKLINIAMVIGVINMGLFIVLGVYLLNG